MAWRALGKREDLDLDFGGARDARRGALVTRVLVTCGDGAVDDASAWRLTLAGRAGGLAAVVALTRDTRELPLTVRCPACGEASQVALPLDTVLALARRAEDERVVSIDGEGETLQVRRPTGEDQRRWQAREYPSSADAERAVMGSLLADASLLADPAREPAAIARVSAAMQELDPLPGLSIATTCPECGAETEHPLDIEALMLNELAREQRGMLREVHRLAKRYGWSEDEVLALPRWRRRAYLALLDEEAS